MVAVRKRDAAKAATRSLTPTRKTAQFAIEVVAAVPPDAPRPAPDTSAAATHVQMWCRTSIARRVATERRERAKGSPVSRFNIPLASSFESVTDLVVAGFLKSGSGSEAADRSRLEELWHQRLKAAESLALNEGSFRDRLRRREQEQRRALFVPTLQRFGRAFLSIQAASALRRSTKSDPSAPPPSPLRPVGALTFRRRVSSRSPFDLSPITRPPLPPGDAVEDLLRQRVKQAVALDANQQRFWDRLLDHEAEERQAVHIRMVQRFARAWLSASTAAQLEGVRIHHRASGGGSDGVPFPEDFISHKSVTEIHEAQEVVAPPQRQSDAARAARVIARAWRTSFPLRHARRGCRAAIAIQGAWHTHLAQRALQRRLTAATEERTQRLLAEIRADGAAVTLQCLWRSLIAHKARRALLAARTPA
jgi:hypothetical protein